MYVALVDKQALCCYLLTQIDKMNQFPIYFVSEALLGVKLNYSELEKIAYTLVMASRKLKHYFQAHRIIVLSAQHLEALFSNSEAFERIGKWAAKLNECVVDFEHRSTIKSHVLARFHCRLDIGGFRHNAAIRRNNMDSAL